MTRHDDRRRRPRWSLVRLFQQQVDSIRDVPSGVQQDRRRTRSMVVRRLLRKALWIRLLVLLAMALSCRLIPDVNDDETVAVFDLRVGSDCFALPGSFYHCRNVRPTSDCLRNVTGDDPCVLRRTDLHGTLQDYLYPWLLTPLTRWDAARFLRLARDPLHDGPRTRFMPTHQTPLEQAWIESEQAHPFLPGLPTAIRHMEHLLRLGLPNKLLPATYEQTLTLAAWILNTLCFLISTYCMFQMTYNLLEAQACGRAKKRDGELSDEEAIHWATRTTLLFLINPANVFFGSAYSESLFCCLVWIGCLLLDVNGGDSVLPLLLWFLATRTRTNGILYLGQRLLYLLGRTLQQGPKKLGYQLTQVTVVLLFFRGTLQWHNLQGIIRHCYDTSDGQSYRWWHRLVGTLPSPEQSLAVRPDWCHDAQTQGSVFPFDLYAHVQRKYWNVGVLRYYTLRQIPNVILATPILTVALCGVATWLRYDWTRYRRAAVGGRGPEHRGMRLCGRRTMAWAVDALALSATPASCGPTQDGLFSAAQVLAGSNRLLGHYAVLCAAALLCLLVAHVQIATRLICSTCPAVYWYMATLVPSPDNERPEWLGNVVLGYCLLYNLLGVIMHPNWLPWT